MPVVLDTNVLVSALLTPLGNPAKIYRMFMTETIKVVYCAEIIAEYGDVLERPRLKIPADAAETVLAAIREHGEKIEPTPSTHDMVDEDDRVFYDTARSAKAYLVTGNTKHYPDEAFILTPTEFLSL
ncbi:MAG: putative toxin-antitoxin system toxin component, PIN family [Propionibacteriaceae bacterium]|nr:putative toxin-antitoxin system toxin component, PIN family [Propionibacteriaceae bacterium]